MNGLWISKLRICVLKHKIRSRKNEESLYTPLEDWMNQIKIRGNFAPFPFFRLSLWKSLLNEPPIENHSIMEEENSKKMPKKEATKYMRFLIKEWSNTEDPVWFDFGMMSHRKLNWMRF